MKPTSVFPDNRQITRSVPRSSVMDDKAIQTSDLSRRRLGAFYTPQSAAEYMTSWALRGDYEQILEPSFGDGAFLNAAAATSAQRNFIDIRVIGVEIDERARTRALQHDLIDEANMRAGDFLDVLPFGVDAVVGNPPYVRLRHLPDSQRERALSVAEAILGHQIDPSASLWMPFVLHSMSFLNKGGRLAFVLPYELTYVRYARLLWKKLSESFGSLNVMRVHERIFPDLLQDVVILLADEYGSETSIINYQAFEHVEDLLKDCPVVRDALPVLELLRGERVFIAALLGPELKELLSTRIEAQTTQARNLITFNIGYVAGDKDFFHPDETQIRNYDLPMKSLRPTITSARGLKGAGLWSSFLEVLGVNRLFFPKPNALSDGERSYIAYGEEQGVSERYKCRIRTPWYMVPGTKVPDVVLTVFSERPVLMINDGRFLASNSLLCGYCTEVSPNEIATAWYTSLTLLQCEIEVHALGGGVMIMVPGEAGNIRLPRTVRVRDNYLSQLDYLIRHGKLGEAYKHGDNKVLVEQLGMTEKDIDLIRYGIQVLAHWRTSGRSSRGAQE